MVFQSNENKIKKEEILTILHAFKFLIILVTKFINTHKRCPDIVDFCLPRSIKQNLLGDLLNLDKDKGHVLTTSLKIKDKITILFDTSATVLICS